MPDNPAPHRVLKVSKNHMPAADVRGIQRHIGVTADGIYGPKTRQRAVARALHLGVAKSTIKAGLTIGAQRLIRGMTKPTVAQRARAKARATRKKVLAARRPLRLKAWDQMQRLIDEKVTEVGGNNLGKRVDEIIRANHGTPGEPWCGDTVAACYLWAGARSVVRAWAAVRELERLLARVPRALVRCGHVVTYTFDHTGLFDSWAPEHGPGYFWAGEGNTGNQGAQSDSVTGGDGVKLKLRHVSQVAGFWRVAR